MSEIPTSRELLDLMAGYSDTGQPNASSSRTYRIGVVDPAYAGVGNPKVTFEGETTMGTRTYPYFTDPPRASERVLLHPVGNTYAIVGTIGQHPTKLTGTTTTSLASTEQPFQIGQSAGVNVASDSSSVQARNNGAAAAYSINDLGGDVNMGGSASKVQVNGVGDVSLSSTAHSHQIGPTNGSNIATDGNELQSRNNGSAASYGINLSGGTVTVGNSSSVVAIPGNVTSANVPWAVAGGSVSCSASALVSVTHPSGRFNVTPRVVAGVVSGTAIVSVPWITGVDGSGFDIRVFTLGGAQVAAVCNYRSMQATSSAASG